MSPPGCDRQCLVQIEARVQHAVATPQNYLPRKAAVFALCRETIEGDLAALPISPDVHVQRHLRVIIVQRELPVSVLRGVVKHREGAVGVEALAVEREQPLRDGIDVLVDERIHHFRPETKLRQDDAVPVHRVRSRLRQSRGREVLQLSLQEVAVSLREHLARPEAGSELLEQPPIPKASEAGGDLGGPRAAGAEGGGHLEEGAREVASGVEGEHLIVEPLIRLLDPLRSGLRRARSPQALVALSFDVGKDIRQRRATPSRGQGVSVAALELVVVAAILKVHAHVADEDVVGDVALAHVMRPLARWGGGAREDRARRAVGGAFM
mmetsp:Transcript_113467/g.321089  ORF Transcript_113467/g.321089 Transcript_113467/m.321089 type:complete len:324 (-) Transcript_113467:107-1078(-)